MATEKWYLDTIQLESVTITDNFSISIAKYSILYKKGPNLEKMGLDERSIKIHLFFKGLRYGEHKDFIDILSGTEINSHELQHPVWGRLIGCVENVSITYDERQRCAEIDLTFIVEGDSIGGLSGDIPISIARNVEDSFLTGQQSIQDSGANALIEDTGADSGIVGESDIDKTVSLLDQFTTVSQATRNYLQQIDLAIETCSNWYADVITSPSNFTSTIEFGAKLPGVFVSAVVAALDRTAEAKKDVSDSPATVLSNLRASYTEFIALFNNDAYPAKDLVEQVAAVHYGLIVANYYDVDNANAMRLKTVEASPLFTVLGDRVIADEPPQIMTITDLEYSVRDAREFLQRAIDLNRDAAESFKRIAYLLLTHVENVRLQREKIITVNVDTEMPLLLIMKRNGLPEAYVDRILSINPDIVNPNFVKGRVNLYAR